MGELSPSAVNAKGPPVQVWHTPSPPSSDTQNQLQSAQPIPYPTGRGESSITETTEPSKAESVYSEAS